MHGFGRKTSFPFHDLVARNCGQGLAVVFVLSRIGLVTARFLLRNFRYAILMFSIAAAILTPSTTIPPMLGFMAVMTGIYVVSIVVAWIFAKPRTTV